MCGPPFFNHLFFKVKSTFLNSVYKQNHPFAKFFLVFTLFFLDLLNYSNSCCIFETINMKKHLISIKEIGSVLMIENENGKWNITNYPMLLNGEPDIDQGLLMDEFTFEDFNKEYLQRLQQSLGKQMEIMLSHSEPSFVIISTLIDLYIKNQKI